jgi:hypothetical protein
LHRDFYAGSAVIQFAVTQGGALPESFGPHPNMAERTAPTRHHFRRRLGLIMELPS